MFVVGALVFAVLMLIVTIYLRRLVWRRDRYDFGDSNIYRIAVVAVIGSVVCVLIAAWSTVMAFTPLTEVVPTKFALMVTEGDVGGVVFIIGLTFMYVIYILYRLFNADNPAIRVIENGEGTVSYQNLSEIDLKERIESTPHNI